ncbi:MAG: tetratricopeptide repeat protein, partial [Anaerolineales bacterium]
GAPTAPVAARPAASGPAAKTPTPTTQPAQPVKKGYVFKWWHGLIGLSLVGCCLFMLAAAAQRRNDPRSPAGETQVMQLTAPAPATTGTALAAAAPLSGDALVLLDTAEGEFKNGNTQAALEHLDQAVTLASEDVRVWLSAGDLALANNFAVHALQRYYLPGGTLEPRPPEALAAAMQSHTALAFYLAAADPNAGDFLKQQAEATRNLGMADFGFTRFNIFHQQGEATFDELQARLGEAPDDPVGLFLAGDYFLSQGKAAEATRSYQSSLNAAATGRLIPPWLRLETECNLKKLGTLHADAKLEPSCESPSSLLIGR